MNTSISLVYKFAFTLYKWYNYIFKELFESLLYGLW